MFGVTEEKIQTWGQKGKKDKLLKAAGDSRTNIRLAVVKAMGNIDEESVVNALIRFLRDREASVRMAAIDSLVKLNSPIAVEHIRSLISDTDTKVGEKAKEALITLGKKKK